jgi:hypothetical protein
MQLDFLDISTAPAQEVTGISWSPSKMNTARQCSRRLYYQYFGSKKHKAKNDPDKQRLAYLSKLSNKALVSGEIVHAVIAIYLRKAKLNDVWTLDRTRGFAFHILDQAIEYSKNEKNNNHVQFEFPPAILKELYYGEVSEKEIVDEIRAKLDLNLTNFVKSHLFEPHRMGGRQYTSLIEEKAKFKLTEDIRIDSVVDLAFQNGTKFQIVDWKTGKADVEETSLQLLTYALWAIQSKKIERESIVIEKAYLGEDKLDSLEFSELHLTRAKTRIRQDAEILRELSVFGFDGNEQAFAKCGKPKICKLCPFEEVCSKRK